MAQVRLLPKTTTALNGYFAEMRKLENVFKQAGLPASQITLLTMHLAEIDEASARYQKLIASLGTSRAPSDNGKAIALAEQLIQIQVALEHIVAHARAVSRLLAKSIDALDSESE